MRKIGFTLAEVLITLGIIGVIAALTLPSLTSNVQKSHIGPALAKAINTLQNANRNAMVHYGASDIMSAIDSVKSGGHYIDLLEAVVSGTKDANDIKGYTFISKDGIMFKLVYINTSGITTGDPTSPKNATALDKEGKQYNITKKKFKYHHKFYTLLIDINSHKKPNSPGEDQFFVYLDTSGAIIPAGGNEAKGYTKNAVYKTVAQCKDAPSYWCAGVIADNGWKVPY